MSIEPRSLVATARALALARVVNAADSTSAAQQLAVVARSTYLTPHLARVMVDDAFSSRAGLSVDSLRHIWSDTSSRAFGQLFGRAYSSVRRQDWEAAEIELLHLAETFPENAEVFRELARIYFAQGRKHDCIDASERALRAAASSGDLEAEIVARGNLLYAELRWNGPTERAREGLKNLIELSRRHGDRGSEGMSWMRLGELDLRRSNYDDALLHLDRAEKLANPGNVASYLYLQRIRGELLRRLHRYDEARPVLDRALEMARANRQASATASITLSLIQVYEAIGLMQTALSQAQEYLAEADRSGVVDTQIASRVLLGRMYYRTSDFERSVALYREALDIAISDQSEWRIRDINLALGDVYACMGQLEKARWHFSAALESAEADSDSLVAGRAMYQIAGIYHHLGNFELATEHVSNAIRHLSRRQIPASLSSAYVLSAELAYHRGDNGEALAALDSATTYAHQKASMVDISYLKGLISLGTGLYPDAIRDFNRALEYARVGSPEYNTWSILNGLATTYWRIGRDRDAEAAFQEGLRRVELRRADVSTARERSLLARTNYSLYESYAAFLDDHGRYTEAVQMSERGRSRALVDLLYATQRARGLAAGDPLERAISADTKSRAFASERAEMVSSPESSGEARSILAYIKQAEASSDSLFKTLEQNLRGTDPLYTFAPIGVEESQGLLGPDEAIVVYSLRSDSLDRQRRSVAYVIRADSLAFVPLALESVNLEESVRFFRDAITNSDRGPGAKWESTAKRLHSVLVEPVLSYVGTGTKHLHIIPEGPLHYLPFSALQDENGHFLVERFDLSFAPSLTVLKLCRQQNPLRWRSMLLLADPDGDLPGARHEATMIASNRPQATRLVLADSAKQHLLEEEASKYDVLHLATHGTFRARSPLASQLKLRDDVLTVDEIGQLNLNAYLVTLSACQTALSGGLMQDHAPGEEWVGFYQAFLAAGTPTVVASLWTIHDRFSGPLMIRFYQKLEKVSKGHALAEVQRSFIADERTRHPYYWAAFTVLGDPR